MEDTEKELLNTSNNSEKEINKEKEHRDMAKDSAEKAEAKIRELEETKQELLSKIYRMEAEAEDESNETEPTAHTKSACPQNNTGELLSKPSCENETLSHQSSDAATAETYPFSSCASSFSPKVDTAEFAEARANNVECLLKLQVKALEAEKYDLISQIATLKEGQERECGKRKEKKDTDVNTGDVVRPMEDIKHTAMIPDPHNTIKTTPIHYGRGQIIGVTEIEKKRPAEDIDDNIKNIDLELKSQVETLQAERRDLISQICTLK